MFIRIYIIFNNILHLLTKKVTENINGLEKILKLTTTKKTTNMWLFDENQQLRKYKTVYEIIDKYYPIRI